MLCYDPQRDVWHCETLWMSDATFKAYVDARLEYNGLTHPLPEQLRAAALHCRQVPYWKDCIDPDVHLIGLPPQHDPRPLFSLLTRQGQAIVLSSSRQASLTCLP